MTHDLLGIFERFTPKFVKRYANLSAEMRKAFGDYKADVKARAFPGPEHTVDMSEDEWEELEEAAQDAPRFVVREQNVS